MSGLDQLPHLEVPYPLTNGGQQLRHASGRCPEHFLSVTYILGCKFCKSNVAARMLLVKCYDIKIVKLTGGFFYRIPFMQLTNKKMVRIT